MVGNSGFVVRSCLWHVVVTRCCVLFRGAHLQEQAEVDQMAAKWENGTQLGSTLARGRHGNSSRAQSGAVGQSVANSSAHELGPTTGNNQPGGIVASCCGVAAGLLGTSLLVVSIVVFVLLNRKLRKAKLAPQSDDAEMAAAAIALANPLQHAS